MSVEKTIKNQSFKITIGTAVVVILAIVGCAVSYNSRILKLEGCNKHLDAKTDLYAERYDAIVEKQTETELGWMEIKTKLVSIEAMVLEIKNDLKTN